MSLLVNSTTIIFDKAANKDDMCGGRVGQEAGGGLPLNLVGPTLAPVCLTRIRVCVALTLVGRVGQEAGGVALISCKARNRMIFSTLRELKGSNGSGRRLGVVCQFQDPVADFQDPVADETVSSFFITQL